MTGDRTSVITLVHGTFARDAPWTRPNSALSTSLERAGCHVTRFPWSGRNSHRARSDAAEGLTEHLQRQLTEHPLARHWVIAHSHGGNVALHAADRLRTERGRAARVTTVTLATPFLHARPRSITGWPVFVIVLFSALLLGSAAATAVTGPQSPADAALVIGGSIFAAILALCVAGAVLHRRSLGPGWRSRLIGAIHAPTARPDETVVIRAAGDEASGLLAAGQFVGWLSAAATRLLTNLWFWTILIAVPQFAFVVASLVGRGGRLAFDLLVYGFAAPGLVMVAVAAAMAGSAVVFGIDGPFAGLVASCSAEAAPPGAATLLQLEPRADPTRKGLAHSSLYNDDQVIRYILSAVQTSSRS
ncbi:alpha/beta hydrolase [Micromonospora sp. NPDC023888]|uniref:esterase/lipase family protein n=1 Tax=Micromonospora sp. NPDC023888 TaxID=3155607 RepID=UPI0033E7595D